MANLCIKHEFNTTDNWVFEYDVTVDYHKDTLVHYKDDKIYQSYDCEKKLYIIGLDSECCWYYGQDYQFYQDVDGTFKFIGYLVNNQLVLFKQYVNFNDVGTWYYDDEAKIPGIFVVSAVNSDGSVSVEQVAIKIAGVYVFYEWAFNTFEKGMYILHIDYSHPLVDTETQVYYAIWRTLGTVSQPLDFHDSSKFESVGVAVRHWVDCEHYYWQYMLFYSEYPCCWDLTKGEFVYTEKNHGYNKIGQAIYETTKVPFKGCGDLTTQTKVLSTKPVPWKNNDIYWVYDFDNSPVYHKGAYIYYKDGKIYQSYDCEQKIYPDDDECIWHWGQDYKMYRIINGVNTHVGWIVNGSMQVFFDQYSNYAEEGNFLFKDDAIYQIGNVNVCTVTINQSDNQHITVVVNGVRTHTDSFKVYSGALLQCSIESDDGYTAGTLNIYGISVTTDLTIEATPAVASQ